MDRNEPNARSRCCKLVAAGLSDKLIAARLGIARSTVSTHVSIILQKLDAANRAEAAAIAIRDKIIEPPSAGKSSGVISRNH